MNAEEDDAGRGLDKPGESPKRKPDRTGARDPVAVYFEQIDKYPLLTREQEIELGKKLRGHDKAARVEARDKLILSNLRLVVYLARKLHSPKLQFLDEIQAGNIGLLRAAEMFDWRKGFRFSTYASWWINRVLKIAAEGGEMVRIPRYLRGVRGKVRDRKTRTDDEIAQELGENKRTIRRVRMAPEVVSLDAPIKGKDGNPGKTLGDTVAAETPYSLPPDYLYEQKEEREQQKARLEAMLKSLSEREAQVLRLRWGLDGDSDALTLEETAARSGVSRQSVSQIEKRALRKAKAFLEDKAAPE